MMDPVTCPNCHATETRLSTDPTEEGTYDCLACGIWFEKENVMDPTTALIEALQALADYRIQHRTPLTDSLFDTDDDNRKSAALRFHALATWIERGGVVPSVREIIGPETERGIETTTFCIERRR